MRPLSLSAPVGSLMRPTLTIEGADSLALATARFRENGASVLPVVIDGRLAGIVTDATLAKALGESVEATDAVENWLGLAQAKCIHPYETGAEALRNCEFGETLVVVDDRHRVLGLISAVDLWPRVRTPVRPPTVGGMATPFGVYLTTGVVNGGVPMIATMATGAVMFLMLALADAIVEFSFPHLKWMSVKQQMFIAPIAIYALFFLQMRLFPLAGTHGAEHQVVHAIEREEELHPKIVRRMPRVHPRCGTNLAVGASIFIGLFTLEWTSDASLRLLLAALVTVCLWKPVGNFFQLYVTTRPPTDKQLNGGIEAGKMLLERHASARVAYASPLRRIWQSGLLFTLAGAAITASVLAVVLKLLHVDLGLVS